MEKYICDPLNTTENKAEVVRKYGLKEKEKDYSAKKFLLLMFLSILFLFVIMWLLYLISEKK